MFTKEERKPFWRKGRLGTEFSYARPLLSPTGQLLHILSVLTAESRLSNSMIGITLSYLLALSDTVYYSVISLDKVPNLPGMKMADFRCCVLCECYTVYISRCKKCNEEKHRKCPASLSRDYCMKHLQRCLNCGVPYTLVKGRCETCFVQLCNNCFNFCKRKCRMCKKRHCFVCKTKCK